MIRVNAAQLVKDYTRNNVKFAVEFYLDTNSSSKYYELTEHLRMSFEMGKTFSPLVSHFYSWIQHHKETEDQFADVFQILSRKAFIGHQE